MRNQNNLVDPSLLLKKKTLPNNLNDHDLELPMFYEYILAQYKDELCKQSRQLVGIPSKVLTFGENEILVRKAPIVASIQELVSTSLSTRLLQQVFNS